MFIKNKQQFLKEICNGKSFKYCPFLKRPFSHWKLTEFIIDDILYKHRE